MRIAAPALLALTIGAVALDARADVTGPAPPPCPPGTVGSHRPGHFCAVVECTADADCETGTTCRERAYCVRPARRGDVDHLEFRQWCGRSGWCPDGSTCSIARYCGPAVDPPPDPLDEIELDDDAASDAVSARGSGSAWGASLGAMCAIGWLASRARGSASG